MKTKIPEAFSGVMRTQDKRVRKLVKRAYEIPFYRKRFDEAGVKPEDIRTGDDLSKLPLLTKDELRAWMNEEAKDCLLYTSTEYRLVLSSAGKSLTGAMTYGGIVSYELQERAITVSSDEAKTQTVGEWKKSEKTNLTYTVETTEKDRKKVDEVSQPLSCLLYTSSALS